MTSKEVQFHFDTVRFEMDISYHVIKEIFSSSSKRLVTFVFFEIIEILKIIVISIAVRDK